MSTKAIVSYDDTPNDHDALMLGARPGRGRRRADRSRTCDTRRRPSASASSSRSTRPTRCSSAAPAPSATSTSSAASWSVRRPPRGSGGLPSGRAPTSIVFGSDYRTAAGHVAPQKSAQALLEDSPAAVAIAPANYRSEHATHVRARRGPRRPGRRRRDRDRARARREPRRARVTRDEPYVDLLVIGSRPEAGERRRDDHRPSAEADRERHLPRAGRATRRDGSLPAHGRRGLTLSSLGPPGSRETAAPGDARRGRRSR